jgi:hypothetical protein
MLIKERGYNMSLRYVKFSGSYWYVLKEESNKVLLSGYRVSVSYEVENSSSLPEFFEKVYQKLNGQYYDRNILESDKKYVQIVTNKYPTKQYEVDELGFSRTVCKLVEKKDRFFPLKYDDARFLDSNDLGHVCYADDERVILLPQTLSSNQIVPTVRDWRYENPTCQINSLPYETIRNYAYDEGESFSCIPCCWVDKKAIQL